MDPIVQKIAENFGIKPISIRKSKFYYIIRTNNATYILRQAPCQAKVLEDVYAIKNILLSGGFKALDQYTMSSQNKPYYYYDSNNYVLTRHRNLSEIELKSTSEVSTAISTLACAHSLTKGHTKPYNIDLYSSFNDKKASLFTIKKGLAKKSRLSDIDVLFLRNYEYYTNLCEQAISLLAQGNYEPTNILVSFCHNAFKEDNILISSKDTYITNWEKLSNNYYLYDLSSFIERYIKKVAYGANADSLPVLDVMQFYEIYTLNNPIDNFDLGILKALLIFPSKYISICNNYYSKKRTWAPVSITSRLEGIVEQKDFYLNYITPLINV